MTQSEAQAALAALTNAEISAESLDDLGNIILTLARQKKALEAEKAEKADPLHAAWKKALAPISKRLNSIEEAIDQGKAKYLECLDIRLQALQTAVDEGRFEDAEALTDEPGSLTVTHVKEVSITGTLPEAFMVPDLKKIKAALLAGEEVPGATLIQKRVIRCDI
jgi:hypothetical protein